MQSIGAVRLPYEGEDTDSCSSLRTPSSSFDSDSGDDESELSSVPELRLQKSYEQERKIHAARPRDKRKSVDIYVRKMDASPCIKKAKQMKNESFVQDYQREVVNDEFGKMLNLYMERNRTDETPNRNA